MASFYAYGEVQPRRQDEIIKGLGQPRAEINFGANLNELAKRLVKEMREQG